jgi:hypothetical protein
MRELLRIMRAKEILKNRNRDTYSFFGSKDFCAWAKPFAASHLAFTWIGKGV